MVRIGAHATESREVLHGRRNTERVESTYVSQADIDYRDRVAGYRALIDEGVEVKPVVACLRPQVQDRRKILINANRR